jgi:hypothetical protein
VVVFATPRPRLLSKQARNAAPTARVFEHVRLSSTPPNPNLALNSFLTADATGAPGPVFDAASWANVAMSDASWANASWASASWANASWATASWANAAFADASWANASWASASWASTSSEDNAAKERNPKGGYFLTAQEKAELGMK